MLRIYDEFLEDETILQLKALTYKLHVSALIYCSKNLTDGEVTERAAKVLQAILGYSVKRHIVELVEAGVWIQLDAGGWSIRNYLEFNPPALLVKKERAAGRERMRKMREKRACSPERDGEHAAERYGARDGERSPAVPVLTSPYLERSKGFSFDGGFGITEKPSDFQIPQLREAS